MGQFATCVALGGGRGAKHLAEEEFFSFYFCPLYIVSSSSPLVAIGRRGLGSSTMIAGCLTEVVGELDKIPGGVEKESGKMTKGFWSEVGGGCKLSNTSVGKLLGDKAVFYRFLCFVFYS